MDYSPAMALHPLAREFDAVADAYERGRPAYPPAVIGRLADELGVAPGDRVLDLAAGTGKLTKALVDFGLDVVAVEPQQSLRRLLSDAIGAERVREGTAEAIPLEDGSVAGVTVADAFHWFEPAGALAEIARVLQAGGGLALLACAMDWGGASWAHEVGSAVAELRGEHPLFDGPSWQQAVKAAGGWTEPREIQLTFSQQTDPERVIDYIGSMSWMAALAQERRTETLSRLGAIIRAGDTPPELPVHVRVGLTARA
jgi:ubiquinone/menaquinone biosynthesis C-methylase UbiE